MRSSTFIAIDRLGQRLGEFGLAHAGRSEEQESRHRLAAFAQARPRQPHGIGHRAHRFVLAHEALVQPLLQMQQLLAFFHRQLVDRNANSARRSRDMLALDFGVARGALAFPFLDELEFISLASMRLPSSAVLSYCLREAT